MTSVSRRDAFPTGLLAGLLVLSSAALVTLAYRMYWFSLWDLRGLLIRSGEALVVFAFFVVFLLCIRLFITSDARLSAAASLTAAALLSVAAFLVFFVAPMERTMGAIQRIFYFHLASGWVAFFAFFIVFAAAVSYLIRRSPRCDWIAVSAAEVGLAFITVVLITGPIWAKPVWGVWWTWDARLTSTFVLWLLYISYLLLRNLISDPGRRAVVSAVFAIFAFLDVPIVYMSIRWWRTQHPQPVIGGGEGSGLDPVMRRILWVCVAAMLALCIHLIRRRFVLEAVRHEVAELSYELEGRVANPRLTHAAAPREAR